MIEDHYARCIARDAKMRDLKTADNMDVRKSILARVKSGEITLAQGQSELAEIQRQARRDGKPCYQI